MSSSNHCVLQAFIIYDAVLRRVLAARDRYGAQPLHWGASPDGRFMLGTDLVDLKDCNPTATPFPAGQTCRVQGLC